MLRDSQRNRRHIQGKTSVLPMPVYLGHPVSLEPTNSPSYIDGQVTDILVEVQEATVVPFIEGTTIGKLRSDRETNIQDIGRHAYNQMSHRVWAAHRKKSRRARLLGYTADHKAAGLSFRWTWLPAFVSFTVKRIEGTDR